jgi:TonB-dependent SusC/RagA subfamily outer membrane receptor
MVDDVRLKDGLEMQLVASDDILEVTVIKDSSATLTYGSSAQDGVILIQTKSGTFEQKRRAYYHALIKEKLTWAEKRPRRKLQVQFVLNGTLLTDWEPLRNQKPSEVRDLRTLTSAEGRKEFQKKRKGLWYVIETVK